MDARITATLQNQCHRAVLRLNSREGGTLSILSLDIRDPLASVKAVSWVEQAEELLTSGAVDVLSIDPDGAEVLATYFGV